MSDNKLLTGLVLLALALTAGCSQFVVPDRQTDPQSLTPGQYTLDTNHTSVLFKTDHLGFSTFVGRFNEVDASLDYEPDNLAAFSLSALIGIASLDLVDSDLADVLLDDADWFAASSWPRARFESVSVSPGGNGQLLIDGELTLKGISAPVSLLAEINSGGTNLLTGRYTIGFSASGSFRRSVFGMDSWTGLVGDEIRLEIHGEFQRQ